MRWRLGYLGRAAPHAASSRTTRAGRCAAGSAEHSAEARTVAAIGAPLPEAPSPRPHLVAVSAGASWSWQMPLHPSPATRMLGVRELSLPMSPALPAIGRPPLAPVAPPRAPSLSLPPAEPARLRIPSELLRRMTAVARATGRSESALWSEAAREWLMRQVGEDDPPPPPPAAGAHPTPRAREAWAEIDLVLAQLRGARTVWHGPDPSRPAA